jgi:cell wall-associated NlpC family hydrolase
MPGKGPYYAAVATGGLFVYSALRRYSILQAVQNIIRGQSPGAGQSSASLGNAGGTTSGSSGTSGGAAGIAQGYVGKLTYHYGGPPPAGTVDCSSFASKVLDQAGIKNPGGAPFNPDAHGPNTISYLTWSGAWTVGHSASDAQVNDLVVWQTHMGICIGNGEMVSARDPQEGVGIDKIAGDMPLEILFVRRLR